MDNAFCIDMCDAPRQYHCSVDGLKEFYGVVVGNAGGVAVLSIVDKM